MRFKQLLTNKKDSQNIYQSIVKTDKVTLIRGVVGDRNVNFSFIPNMNFSRNSGQV